MVPRFSLVFGGLLTLGLAVPGVSVHAQSLEDAMAAAYNGNPTLLSKRAELRATDEGVPQALSEWRPSVSMEASTGQMEYYSSSNDRN